MKYINKHCADVGTVNCPCPLAETGDCQICGRLSGKETCDCHWAGLCIYNEYIQNGGIVRNPRRDQQVRILRKTWYGADLLELELETSRDMALNAAAPGSFIFLRAKEDEPFTNVPVSIMLSDVEKGRLHVVLKIISSKTKRIADAEGFLVMRGIYRNGLLGGGLEGMEEDLMPTGKRQSRDVRPKVRKQPDAAVKSGKWLIMTKGAGFAPAVNLLRWAADRVDVHMIIDTEKISEAIVCDALHKDTARCPEAADAGTKICKASLHELIQDDIRQKDVPRPDVRDYDRVFILASDYYIRTLTETLAIPDDKLIFSNNFHMCCGEGLCGACGHVDGQGNLSKMCKCRYLDIKEMR